MCSYLLIMSKDSRKHYLKNDYNSKKVNKTVYF